MAEVRVRVRVRVRSRIRKDGGGVNKTNSTQRL